MNKYKNKKCQSRDGKWFASMAERDRYEELRLLEKAGKIGDLTTQPRFPVQINTFRICTYIGDFMYTEGNQWVVEDVKSEPTKTPVYRLKRKLFLAYYPHYEHREIEKCRRNRATAKRRSKPSKGM